MTLTPRLEKLKKRLFEVEYHTPKTWHFTDATILTNEEIKKEPLVVRKGLMFRYIAQNLPAVIKDDELIVGNPNMNSVAFGTVVPNYATEEELAKAKEYLMDETSMNGHHPPDFAKVVRIGITGVMEEIHRAMEEENKRDIIDKDKMEEYRAMLLALESVVIFARRHADEAIKRATAEKDPVRRRELMEIGQVCSRVPEYPAETFHEALQSFWLTYCMVSSGGVYIPFGLLDRPLYPFYRKDLESGALTADQAADLMGSFLVKCNERILIDIRESENHHTFGMNAQGTLPKYQTGGSNVAFGMHDCNMMMWDDNADIDAESNFNFGQSGNDWLMNTMVGGIGRDGEDVTSDLSFLIVDLMHEMGLLMPTLAARISKKSPEAFVRKVASVLRHGQGEPLIYNDDAIIPGFVDAGVPIEDAREYSNDGCWETLIPGKSYFTYSHIMNLQILEYMLTGGKSILRGYANEGLDLGDPRQFETYEEFYAAYLKQMDYFIEMNIKRRLDSYQLSWMIAPDPLQSAITDDCIKKGRDITLDGTRYKFHLMLSTGLANTADSLAVIKKLVYDEKSVTMDELIAAVEANWQGYERLHAQVVNTVPKFGNDRDEVDDIVVRLLKDFETQVQYWASEQDVFTIMQGCGTFENYAVLGRPCAASPDGRYHKDPLAPNYSPMAGVDVEGPTAVIRSVCKPELLRFYGGCPTDLAILSNEFTGEVGTDRLAGLIRSWCSYGGQILTITGSSVEELEDAKVNPEKHKDLRVRMGGLSAYFIAMAPAQQDNIIQRFKK